MSHLWNPYVYKDLKLRNRIVMAPMCQYSVSTKDGIPNDWHYTHYTSRAVGGVGLVTIEMTDVHPDGRITDYCLGIWSDEHIAPFARIIDACHRHGAKVSMQIAHAGRKAEHAQLPVAPSAIRYDAPQYKTPHEMSTDEVKRMVENFATGARRAVKAGVDAVELHGAHGYLIHQFQSPLTNKRTDAYGDDLSRFGAEVATAVKAELPSGMPLIMRISAVEYVEGGYGIHHAIELARRYHDAGVDMFHVSSGGEGTPAPGRGPGNFPAYQVPFARAMKEALHVPIIAVGRLDDAEVADSVLGNGDADLVAVGRGLLRDPYWAIHAGLSQGDKPELPTQYGRAF